MAVLVKTVDQATAHVAHAAGEGIMRIGMRAATTSATGAAVSQSGNNSESTATKLTKLSLVDGGEQGEKSPCFTSYGFDVDVFGTARKRGISWADEEEEEEEEEEGGGGGGEEKERSPVTPLENSDLDYSKPPSHHQEKKSGITQSIHEQQKAAAEELKALDMTPTTPRTPRTPPTTLGKDYDAIKPEEQSTSTPPPLTTPPSVVSVSSAFCANRCSKLLRQVQHGLDNGHSPVPLRSGTGGAYEYLDGKGRTVAVIKPADEEPLAPNNPKGYIGRQLGEPGFKPSVRVGEAGLREVAAFLLDHDNFAGVPKTALVRVNHQVLRGPSVEGGKLASIQEFVRHVGDSSDFGASRFPVDDVHKIGILDIRLFNTDRHSGNILIRKRRKRDLRHQLSLATGLDQLAHTTHNYREYNQRCNENALLKEDTSSMSKKTTPPPAPPAATRSIVTRVSEHSLPVSEYELVPIDHGFCLPENIEPPYFEWLHWPQASIPFSRQTLDYISSLNPQEDVELLRQELPLLREECLRLLEITTTLLKRGAAAGMTLAEVGELVSRSVCGMDEEPSAFENICSLARHEALTPSSEEEGSEEEEEDEEASEDLQFDLDDSISTSSMESGGGGGGGGGREEGEGSQHPTVGSFLTRCALLPTLKLSSVSSTTSSLGKCIGSCSPNSEMMHASSSSRNLSPLSSSMILNHKMNQEEEEGEEEHSLVTSNNKNGSNKKSTLVLSTMLPLPCYNAKKKKPTSSSATSVHAPLSVRNVKRRTMTQHFMEYSSNRANLDHGFGRRASVRHEEKAGVMRMSSRGGGEGGGGGGDEAMIDTGGGASHYYSLLDDRKGNFATQRSVLSGLDAPLTWQKFMTSFERQLDEKLARGWRPATFRQLVRPGTSCPVSFNAPLSN